MKKGMAHLNMIIAAIIIIALIIIIISVFIAPASGLFGQIETLFGL